MLSDMVVIADHAESNMELTVKHPRRRQHLEETASRDDYDANHALVEIGLTSIAGLGLFAKQDIKRGSRIISEASLITVKRDDSKPSRLWKQLAKLTPAELDAFDSLSYNKQLLDSANLRRIHNAVVAERKPLKGDVMLKGEIIVEVKRYAIWRTNETLLSSSPKQYGLFRLSARMNHSCAPNVTMHYSSTQKKLNTHAIRDIKAGEEIVRTYINPARHHSKRKEDLETYGITCECDICESHSKSRGELLRNRIDDNDRALKAFEKNIGNGIHGPGTKALRTYEQALTVAQENVRFLEEAGLTDIRYALALHRCSKYHLRLEMVGKAKLYAEKQLEVEICCYGPVTEVPVDKMGVDSAVRWLEQIRAIEETEMRRKAAQAEEAAMKRKLKKGKGSGKKNGKH